MADAELPWRCFVAVPIDSELRAAIERVARDLRARPGAEGWRWADAEAWHVTLAFLGATDPDQVSRLSEALERVGAAHDAMELPVGGLGAFPSRARARVLWYGISDAGGSLRQLAEAVRGALGMVTDERFRGHLTLARARDRFGTDAGALVDAPAPTSRLVVDRLELYRSHLGRGPASYEALTTVPLRGVAP